MSNGWSGFKEWFLAGAEPGDKHSHHQDKWYRVMCLTGVDYFSTLGYQPGIAFLAAGVLSPLATLILVAVTLFGALPSYSIVANESPNGQGSVAMLEKMLPGWMGKALVLALLGFAATAFIITITLSAADGTAHIVENPIVPPEWRQHRIEITFMLIALLGGLFLKGFQEAIGISVCIVLLYLTLSAIIIGDGLWQISLHPGLINDWLNQVVKQYHSPVVMIALSLQLFPKLALGLSGFETGVAVMPLVEGSREDNPESPQGRIKNTQKLLITAGLIMSIFLICSSIATTVLIPAALYLEGGEANGRALAYLAHKNLGDTFGTIYDISTILILWFAGASAIAGLLSLVPKYLPRYGMAPSWAAATRPLVVFFTAVAFAVTWIFHAGVDAQAGAYTTGVLVLITSASLAATITVWKKAPQWRVMFALISFIFIYTCFANIAERPEGLQIALFFVASVLIASLLSRALRSTELRVEKVVMDAKAVQFIDESLSKDMKEIRLLAHRAGMRDFAESERKSRIVHSIQPEEGDFIFVEVELSDASEFAMDVLEVRGVEEGEYMILRCSNSAIPNAIAAILLDIRDRTQKIPHVYFGWTSSHPVTSAVNYIFLGEGEIASITREILRSEEPFEALRPIVHVG